MGTKVTLSPLAPENKMTQYASNGTFLFKPTVYGMIVMDQALC